MSVPQSAATLVERHRRPLLLLAGAAALLLAVAGTASAAAPPGALAAFDLDAELGVAAVLSAALLCLAGAVLALAVSREARPALLHALPAFLVFMAADEFAYLHERAETRTGVDWQLLYLPVVAAAGLAWLLVLRRWGARSRPGSALLAGAACWLVAQVLEAAQWGPGDVPVDGYLLLSTVEELLEAAGSVLFLSAGLLALARRR